jgi:hypothetical protein
VDRKDLLVALKFIVDNASNQAAMQSFVGLEGEANKLVQTFQRLMLPSGINNVAQIFNNAAESGRRANTEAVTLLDTLQKIYSVKPVLALPAGSDYDPNRKQLIGGYPALPSGYEEQLRTVIVLNAQLAQGFKELGSGGLQMSNEISASGKAVINLGDGIDPVNNGVVNLSSGIKLLGSGLIETDSVIDVVAKDLGGIAEATQIADDRFAQFSNDVIARGNIIMQVMEQLGVSYDEAVALLPKMSFAGDKFQPGGAPAGVNPAIFAAQTREYVNTATGATQAAQATNALGLANQYASENTVANTVSQQEYKIAIDKSGSATTGAANKFKAFGAAFAGFQLRFAGTQLMRFGTELLKPIQEYIKYMGVAEQISADWTNSQDDLAKATRDIGKGLAQVALPAMQEIARLARVVGDIFNRYPQIATGTIAVAGISVVLGNIATVAGTLLTASAALKYIAPAVYTAIAGASIGGVAISSLVPIIITAGLPILLATIVSAGVIYLIWKAILAIAGDKGKDIEAAPGKAAALAAGGLGAVWGLLTTRTLELGKAGENIKKGFEDAFLSVGQLTGAITDLGSAAQPTTQDIDAYISYLQSVKDSEKQYQTQRTDIINTYNKDVLDNEKKFASNMDDITKKIADIRNSATKDDLNDAKDRQKMAQDFAKSSRDDEKSLYADRAKAAKSYGIEVQRAEEDHQTKMRRMQEDHNIKILDLLYANDAFGILAESRSYNTEHDRAEQDYSVEARRRSEDFANQLSDMNSNFMAQRAAKLADYAQQLADQVQQIADRRTQAIADLEQQRKDAIAQHKIDLEQLAADEKDKLITLSTQHAEELAKLQTDFNDKLRQLDANLLNEKTLRENYYIAMSKDLQSWLASMNKDFATNLPNYPTTSKAGGGYMFGQTYKVGDAGYEFVLNNSATRSMERAVGGRLTQENILRGGSGRGATINQNFRFAGDMSADQRRWYRQVAHDEALSAVSEAFAG